MAFEDQLYAYKEITPDYSKDYDALCGKLDELVALTDELDSPLLFELKPTMALALKWKFDYLAKTYASPFDLTRDVDYWIDQMHMLKDLQGQSWFEFDEKAVKKDVWDLTKEAFNFMWPKNTDGKDFNFSKKMVDLRLEQIIEMMGGDHVLEGKKILDSGCGPGRYVNSLQSRSPSKIIGLDQGEDIITKNKERFKDSSAVEMVLGSCDALPFEDQSFDFVVSAGVLHHLPNKIEDLVKEHARVVAPGGHFFVFIAGESGLELKMWEFLRKLLNSYPVKEIFDRFNQKISPLRLQGLLDHSYGEYQQTKREDLETWLGQCFSEYNRVPGIAGLDVTEEVFAKDNYFKYRFGSGNLRYLCKK